jgi:putative FmdB family regulatory protein
MPIYEYQCKACGHELEAIQKISDEPLKICPECGQPELNKLVSAAGFRLKGGGWYETDFKSSDKKKNLAGDQTASSSSTSKSTGETAPPAKAPAASS